MEKRIGIATFCPVYARFILIGALSLMATWLGSTSAYSRENSETVPLILSSDPENAGTVNPSGETAVEVGTFVDVAAEPALGWAFSEWTAESGSPQIIDSTMPRTRIYVTEETKIVGRFVESATFNLETSVYPAGAGTVSPSGSVERNIGDVIEIVATATDNTSFFTSGSVPRGARLRTPFRPSPIFVLSKGMRDPFN